MIFHTRAYWALLAALVTLIIVPVEIKDGYFEVPKLALLGIGILLAGISAFLNRGRLKATLPRPALYLLAAYLVWILLTNTVFSSQPSYTLLGWKGWYGGFYMQALFVFTIFLASLKPITDENEPNGAADNHSNTWLFILLGLSAVLVAVSVSEVLGFNPILGSQWFQWNGITMNAAPSGQPYATVGSPKWLAALWILMAPLPLLLRAKYPLWSAIWQLMIAAGVGVTYSKITVSIYILFQVGSVLYLLISKTYRAKVIILSVASIIISVSILFPIINLSVFLKSQGVVSRIPDSSLFYGGALLDKKGFELTSTTRVDYYRVALRLIAKRPLRGWGDETFQAVFYDYLTPTEYRKNISYLLHLKNSEGVKHFGSLHMVFDVDKPKIIKSLTFYEAVKPHNFILEEIYSNGLVGFLIITAALYLILRAVLNKRSIESNLLLLGVGLYAVYLMTWFTMVAITPIACILIAFSLRSPVAAPGEEISKFNDAVIY